MPSEKTLEQAVLNRLLQDQQVSAFDVQVEALHGLVTLRGQVPNARAKLAAHELAQNTPGCATVINELTVVPAAGVSDQEVTSHVRHLLDNHPELTKEAITIQVDGGMITLGGAVGTPEEYVVAEDLARSAQGVRGVHNLLIIDPEAQYDDESLQFELQSALEAAEKLRGLELRVAVSGDLIVLSGEARTARQKELASEIVMGVRPWRIRNDITVAISSPPAENI